MAVDGPAKGQHALAPMYNVLYSLSAI